MSSVQIEEDDDPMISYDDQKRMAREGSHEERRDLAGRLDVRPEILYYLAGDPDPGVRRQIAQNDATPRHADLLLAQDDDDRVRSDVAGKIATSDIAPVGDEQNNVYRVTMQALEILASDQLVRVRQILSESLKDNSGAPRHVIERLAVDKEISVSGPVLEHSPVLTDEFLIGVLNSEPVQGALKAISRRVALGEEVADAIVNTGDAEAVAELLGNDSAQIREETLDRIVDQAPGQPLWHGPLVSRAHLHTGAARRIAEIVSGPLLIELKKHADLDDEALAAIDVVIQRRLDGNGIEDIADIWASADRPQKTAQTIEDPSWAKDGRNPDVPRDRAPVELEWEKGGAQADDDVPRQVKRAQQLHAQGALEERQVSDALNDGETDFVVAAIALLAGVAQDVVVKAASLQNAKVIVALSWKAGFSMRLATRLQMHLAKIPPSGVLRATASDGYPISPEEMTWQLEFISGSVDETQTG